MARLAASAAVDAIVANAHPHHDAQLRKPRHLLGWKEMPEQHQSFRARTVCVFKVGKLSDIAADNLDVRPEEAVLVGDNR